MRTAGGLAAALAAAALWPAATQAEDNRVMFRTPVAFASALPALGSPITYVAESLERISGGSLRMRIYEPGALVAPFEILDSVSSGKANSGYATAVYWTGKMPAAALFSAVPFGPGAPEFMAWLYGGNGLRLYQEMYDVNGYNVHVEPCAVVPPESGGWFAEPAPDPDDLRGLNIRFFGLGGKVISRFGANPALVPGSEVGAAMEQGQLHGAEFSIPTVDETMDFHESANYNYFPGWHQQSTVFELLINKDVWEKDMSAAQRAIVSTVCRASMALSMAESYAAQGPALERMRDEEGVEIRRWDNGTLDALEEVWLEIAAGLAESNEFFGKVWDDYSDFREDYALWEANAHLPRKEPSEE